MENSKVYIVILAWNYLKETIESLDSLSKLQTQPHTIIVVDNASTDETPHVIPRDYPDVVLLRSETNLGVAGGYNIGIEYALKDGADYVLIMNNDIAVQEDFLGELLKVAQTEAQVGIVQPKIYHYYGDQSRLWIVGARWQNFPPGVKLVGADHPDGPPFNQKFDLEFAPSCALLISRAALEKAGMFDHKYFFYFDDWDFCMRIRRAGFRIIFAPEAKMWHKVSVSTAKSDKPSKWWYIMGQSSVRYYASYKNLGILFVANVWFVLSEIIKRNFKRIIPYIAGVVNGHARRKGWVPE